MALTVNYLYQFALKLIKKNQAGGLTSTEFQYHWNDAQATYQDDLLGRFQLRNNGKEGNNTGLIENDTILQKLSPFTKLLLLNVNAITGQASKPADFIYELGMRVGNNEVVSVTKDQLPSVLGSVIDPPSTTDGKYYVTEYEGYYQFYPSASYVVNLDYICTPTDVVWGFTFDVDNRQVYDSATSVQPAWDSNSCREITKRMLTNLGVSFKDADFATFGKSVQVTGE